MDDAEAVRQCRAGQVDAFQLLGAAHIVLVVTVVLLNLDRLSRVVEVLRAVSDVK